MEKILLKISYLFIAVIMLYGCENFLTEDPRDILSPANFFNSDAEAKAAVNGIYSTYFLTQDLYQTVGLSRFYMFGTDEINPNRLGGEGLDFSAFSISEGNNPSRETWTSLYLSLIHI